MGHPFWPLFDLEVRTPRLTLRYLDDHLATELASLAGDGIHDPSFMPFSEPWTDLDSPQMERQMLQYQWRNRAALTPASWDLLMAVVVDGTTVGMTHLSGRDFPVLREFTTGSWLGRAYQGRGLGKELRRASLVLGFEGLRAAFACTAAFHDNAPSLGVTRSLGYEAIGRRHVVRRGARDETLEFRMDRAGFDAIRRDDVEIDGIAEVRNLLEID